MPPLQRWPREAPLASAIQQAEKQAEAISPVIGRGNQGSHGPRAG